MAEPKIQQLSSPQGVTFWLVESHQIPMVSVEVAFRSGSAFEPVDKAGVANLTASLLDEGAGDLDAKAFKEALDEVGARFGAGADKLDISISLTSLAEHRLEAARLAALAIVKPRFDGEAVERIKAAIVAGIKQSEESPGAVASKAFMKAVFDTHAYGRQSVGTVETVSGLGVHDVQGWHVAQFNRANMVVSVVGDVTPADAGVMVDMMVAGLPLGAARHVVTDKPSATTAQLVKVQKDLPQAVVMVGHVGMSRDDPDYYAMLVMNDMLGGGGGLSSRLFDEVREKHGLVYHVSSSNMALPLGGVFMVQLQTENGKAQKALKLVRQELDKMRKVEPSKEEFTEFVVDLECSFPLRIDSNAKILDYLTLMQMENLGADYLEQWAARIKTVTPADVRRVAERLIQPDAMAITVVGDGPAMKVQW